VDVWVSEWVSEWASEGVKVSDAVWIDESTIVWTRRSFWRVSTGATLSQVNLSTTHGSCSSTARWMRKGELYLDQTMPMQMVSISCTRTLSTEFSRTSATSELNSKRWFPSKWFETAAAPEPLSDSLTHSLTRRVFLNELSGRKSSKFFFLHRRLEISKANDVWITHAKKLNEKLDFLVSQRILNMILNCKTIEIWRPCC